MGLALAQIVAPKYRVAYVDPHFAERFTALPKEAQRRVLELLGDVANRSPTLGKPCGYQAATGNLGDCRKIYFDTEADVEPRYRLIYRVLPDETNPVIIEVITVGLKFTEDAEGNRNSIYVRVGELLDRLSD